LSKRWKCKQDNGKCDGKQAHFYDLRLALARVRTVALRLVWRLATVVRADLREVLPSNKSSIFLIVAVLRLTRFLRRVVRIPAFFLISDKTPETTLSTILLIKSAIVIPVSVNSGMTLNCLV
jgi:hypothetical protein